MLSERLKGVLDRPMLRYKLATFLPFNFFGKFVRMNTSRSPSRVANPNGHVFDVIEARYVLPPFLVPVIVRESGGVGSLAEP